MPFVVEGLDPTPFLPLYGLDDDALVARRARRMVVDASPGFPDRIELRDLEAGERVLLVHHTHQPADTPYHASHAVFVLEGATAAARHVDAVPDVLARRLLSVRAFDAAHMMVDADVVDGADAAALFDRFLGDPRVDYLQVHYARRGCYAARVSRVMAG